MQALRRQRWMRLSSAAAVGVGIVAAVAGLSAILGIHPTQGAPRGWSMTGLQLVMRYSALLLSAAAGTTALWGCWQSFRDHRFATDTLESNMAVEKGLRYAELFGAAIVYPVVVQWLAERMHGAPAELAAAALLLVLYLGNQQVNEWVWGTAPTPEEESPLLNAVSDNVSEDTRTTDPLYLQRQGAFRRTLLDRH